MGTRPYVRVTSMAHDATEQVDRPVLQEAPRPDSGSSALELADVNKVYETRHGTVDALSNVNLSVRTGEFVSLVGRSGCGKTTLLRVLAGLLAPSSGSVTANGQSIWKGATRDDDVLRQCGVVFQDAHLFPWFTVAENVSLPLKLRGVGKSDRTTRAKDLCQLVGLSGFESAYPRELSGGMRQRAAIARALSYDPSILLMDEPFGALDALTREKMNLELQSLHSAAGVTVVFVTHSISEAVFLADRVVLLTPRPGRIRSVTPIPLARPRSLDSEATPEFQEIVRTLRHELDEEL
jgi:NitT/TauT family transport system ATP-binding protein